MNQFEQIKNGIEPILKSKDLVLYDLKWVQEGSMKILQVAIMQKDGSMDIEECALVSEEISILLDELDNISEDYYLEVCSPGAERELRSFEEVQNSVGQFVVAHFNEAVKQKVEVKGYLNAVEGDVCKFEYMDKAVKRRLETTYDNISFIRLSVKI